MTRVALITGAAGGIGRATAAVFHDAGWQVIGVDRREDDVPGVDRFITADLADPDAPQRIIEEMRRDAEPLDALVNNAAAQLCKPMIHTTAEEWDAVMAVNARAAFLLMQCAYDVLKDRGGAVVNICSVHAVATSRDIAAYAASKGALLALTRAAALEFAPGRVRVNAVLPGAVDTPMLHEGLSRSHVDGRSADERVHDLGRKHALGRVGRPEEIGRMILFLADSEQSSFITGQAFVVDGGALARLSTE